MNTAFLSLGSNEGDRMVWLSKAMALIAKDCGNITARSSVYETAAWGITDQPDFLNIVVAVQTMLPAEELLSAVLNIENQLGRHRIIKWGPRIIDIDILLYNDLVLASTDLIIPHPYIQDRKFTLLPLAELAPEYVHPKLHKTINQLLAACPDTLEVRKLS